MEELLRRTEELQQVQFKVLELFMVAALYYLAMTTVWGLVQARIEAHFGRSVAHESSSRPRRGGPRRLTLIDKVLLEQDAH